MLPCCSIKNRARIFCRSHKLCPPLRQSSEGFLIKALVVMFVVTLAVPKSTAAWVRALDFDQQPPESSCENIGSSRSYVSHERAYSKPAACRMWIKKGMTGWGTWGGVIEFPTRLYVGDEIWIRLRVYMPTDFRPVSHGEGGRVKFLRIRTRSAKGEHIGYDHIVIDKESRSTRFGFIYEGVNRWKFFGRGLGLPVRGKWVTYEWYVKFGNDFKDNPPKVRFWEDGTLLANFNDRVTLQGEGAFAKDLYIGTYWNGGAPQDQHMFVDDVVITTDTPTQTDEHGYPFVGVEKNGSGP